MPPEPHGDSSLPAVDSNDVVRESTPDPLGSLRDPLGFLRVSFFKDSRPCAKKLGKGGEDVTSTLQNLSLESCG